MVIIRDTNNCQTGYVCTKCGSYIPIQYSFHILIEKEIEITCPRCGQVSIVKRT